MKTSRNDGVIISTVAPSFLAWYGEYETAISIDGKPWRIARGYESLEEAIEGHDRFSKMSKEELMNYIRDFLTLPTLIQKNHMK